GSLLASGAADADVAEETADAPAPVAPPPPPPPPLPLLWYGDAKGGRCGSDEKNGSAPSSKLSRSMRSASSTLEFELRRFAGRPRRVPPPPPPLPGPDGRPASADGGGEDEAEGAFRTKRNAVGGIDGGCCCCCPAPPPPPREWEDDDGGKKRAPVGAGEDAGAEACAAAAPELSAEDMDADA
ncbi:unnamed protein product, partial [Ectocarpus fasciculatus]